jgi:hypothetical protein
MQPASVLSANAGLFVTGITGGKTVKFLVDTGSSLTFLSTATYQSMDAKDRPTLFPVERSLVQADGKSLSVQGNCFIMIHLGGRVIMHYTVVADITTDGILGIPDFLRDNDCLVDTARGMLRFRGIHVLCDADWTQVKCSRIAVAETVAVIDGRERVLPGRGVNPGVVVESVGVIAQVNSFAEIKVKTGATVKEPDERRAGATVGESEEAPDEHRSGATVGEPEEAPDEHRAGATVGEPEEAPNEHRTGTTSAEPEEAQEEHRVTAVTTGAATGGPEKAPGVPNGNRATTQRIEVTAGEPVKVSPDVVRAQLREPADITPGETLATQGFSHASTGTLKCLRWVRRTSTLRRIVAKDGRMPS